MSEPIRLYLDEDTINRSLVNALRARHVDVLTAHEANMLGASDGEQLAYAVAQGRVILTFNVRDYVQLHTEYLNQGKSHAGIVVADQLPVGVTLRRLLTLLDGKTAEEMNSWLEFLSNWR